jgi:hypothetical protein
MLYRWRYQSEIFWMDRRMWDGGVDCINMALDRDRCRVLVNAVMDIRITLDVGNFLTSWKSVSLSRGLCSMDLAVVLSELMKGWRIYSLNIYISTYSLLTYDRPYIIVYFCNNWVSCIKLKVVGCYVWRLMFVLCIIRRSSNNQHYALVCTTPSFYILAPTCLGSSLPSSGSFVSPSELTETQIEWVIYHIMCGSMACVSSTQAA